ncbi:type II secretion system F family protein [Halovulum dunhuangense]|uniref:Type II secretion system F family protein n=1 Tax=Halovulum dunhuangense TaxID=1505036 RepID=A0A849L543_9RHOB|nr:type II secretion system F family protein [Halovulum dunhuangense]NNU81247.1 type II secretion system F family protein [Halovulum dunhuangense]
MATLEQGWAFLIAALGPLGPFYVAGFLGLMMIMMTAPMLFRTRPDPLNKLKGAGVMTPRKSGKETPLRLRYDAGNRQLEKFKPYLEPKSQKEYTATRMKLIQAGYRTRNAVSIYHLFRFGLGVGALAAGTVFVLLFGGDNPSLTMVVGGVLGPGVIGYYAPDYWVERRKQVRQEDITNGFPDALDLMLVCVEAGQSLDQAILRVASEIKNSYPTLSEEFEIVSNEMRAGKDRVTVLRDMGERCGISDISAFVTVLVQSAQFGTSVADALRVYASEMRDKRVMRAEEKANKLPTKLTLGTMMFTVPPLLLILVGPSLYEIAQALF